MGLQDKIELIVRKSFYGAFGPAGIISGVYSEKFLEKSIIFTMNALRFATNIAVYLSVAFLVFKWFYPRYGFEKTVLLLFMSLIALMRAFMMTIKGLIKEEK